MSRNLDRLKKLEIKGFRGKFAFTGTPMLSCDMSIQGKWDHSQGVMGPESSL